ncbi:MAG: small basic family protein [Candidatus Dormibacteraeota bacterium]|uniref:Small basic family protein n=1 Tax=Candidatus Dormiibacter inghamiae TaxID=3127013 RepID=A0A934KCR4_9BACT|nr:small basic family protein [Candidatus Dormibacteraeota bacterium]MBJ7605815.1 small basic family protein [Candidatus Dormibacteraeota bacterium]
MRLILLAVVCVVAGIALGLLSPVTIPTTYARYTAVALLAGLDSIFGALKSQLASTFEPRIFLSGLITNSLLAAGLTYFGDKLGVDLSIAAIVAFGVRIFNNLAAIRRHYI